MKNYRYLLDTNGHLSDEGIALWVDAAENSQLSTLPVEILSHVNTCVHCKNTIVEFREAMHEADDVADTDIVVRPKLSIIRYLDQRRFLRIAASIIVVAAFGSLLYFMVLARPDNPEKLFAAHFQPYDDIISVKGDETPNDSIARILRMGFNFYNGAQFDSASVVFRSLYSVGNQSDTVAFYLANAVLGSDHSPDEAIILLKDLSLKNSIFSAQSRWYLALAYLKRGQPEEAKRELLLLSEESDHYRKLGRKLLKALE